jgi:hypothetical protein
VIMTSSRTHAAFLVLVTQLLTHSHKLLLTYGRRWRLRKGSTAASEGCIV